MSGLATARLATSSLALASGAHGPVGSELELTDTIESGSAHVLGIWEEIDASVSQPCQGLWVASDAQIGSSATNTATILELGFGAAASEVTQVRWYVGGHVDSNWTYLPLHLPAGTRLSGRLQSAVASKDWVPRVILDFAGLSFKGYRTAEAIGLDNATSAPTIGDLTDNDWSEAIASTTSLYRALTFHPGTFGSTSSATDFTLEVGIGGAASEVVLGTWFGSTGTTELFSRLGGPIFVERLIPIGSRLAIRKNGTGDLTGHLIGWR